MKTKKSVSALIMFLVNYLSKVFGIKKSAFDRKTGKVNATAVIESMLTKKHDGKMAGMQSLSTSPILNRNCQKRCRISSLVCSHCFSIALQKMRKGLKRKLARNAVILSRHLFKVSDMPVINTKTFRLESFGDLINEIHAENYVRLAKANKAVKFTLWTKNPWIMYNAIMAYENGKKPGNLRIIYSSPLLNVPAVQMLKCYILPSGKSMIDQIFTVYTAAYALENNIPINCGNRICIACGNCYTKKGIQLINEVVKSEQKCYYAALAKKQKTGKK